ncbi:MAG: LamB/YcsF family protein [Armatimonadetes bacterium]|nr:LamB/YcsF family protein [Armatimonadota bacterium]
MSRTVDLNCDMGEGFGLHTFGMDETLLEVVTSANIACGFHAGDPATMRKTVRLALSKGVAIGAHPGLPDMSGFGRRHMEITPDEAFEMTLYQIGALDAFVRSDGGRMAHVKPHGALYTMASQDEDLAQAVAEAVYRHDSRLILFGLSGSALVRAGERAGLRTASEAFIDRRYTDDGRLVSRRHPDAVITDPEEALRQALMLAGEGKVVTRGGKEIPVQADTLCVHGDTIHAVEFARMVRDRLIQSDIRLQSPGSAL